MHELLNYDDDTVQHNAVEALATLARERPDAVAPAGDRLHELLDHDDVAIQHNVTGTLGALAPTHPEVVVPAVETIAGLTYSSSFNDSFDAVEDVHRPGTATNPHGPS